MRPHVPEWTIILSNSKKMLDWHFCSLSWCLGVQLHLLTWDVSFALLLNYFKTSDIMPLPVPTKLNVNTQHRKMFGVKYLVCISFEINLNTKPNIHGIPTIPLCYPLWFFSVLSFFINVEYHWRKRIDILKDGLLPPLFILALPQNKQSISPQK